MTRRLTWIVTLVVAGAFAGTGCDDDPPPGGGTGGSPADAMDAPGTGGAPGDGGDDAPIDMPMTDVPVGDVPGDGSPPDGSPNLPAAVTQTIGPGGGQIVFHNGRFTVTFPRGSLTRPTEVEVSALAANETPPGALGVAYRVQPVGEELARPARASFKFGGEIGGVSGNELRLGRFAEAHWNDLPANQVDASMMKVSADLPGLGAVALLAGVCRVCATTCDAATCKFGAAMGRCQDYGNNCKKCVPACDSDGDGFCPNGVEGEPRPDCNDSDVNINPDAPEVCGNETNENCDGHTNEGCPTATPCANDAQCKGNQVCVAGVCQGCQVTCDPASCRIGMDAMNPGAPGKCFGWGFGNACNKCVPDCDVDGDGACAAPVPAEIAHVVPVDCNEQNREVHPGAPEVCGNSLDDDCNGYVDDKCDACGDGTNCPRAGFSCVAGACEGCGKTCTVGQTCNLPNPGSTTPGPEGQCVAYGNDCTKCVPKCDTDHDGFCTTSADPLIPGNDCDDTKASAYPGAVESCNNADDDCDDHTDEGCQDCADHGACAGSEACERGVCQPCNNSCDATNCRFGVVEGMPGSGIAGTCMDYGKNNGCKKCVPPCDVDGDGFCEGADQPMMGIRGGDCKPMNLRANPEAPEICGNNEDDDCDGLTDEACSACATATMCSANESCSTQK